MTRRLVAIGAGLVLGAAVLFAAAPASAHSSVVASTPAQDEVLSTLPEEFSVTANEPMLVMSGQGAFALFVQDDAGLYYGDGCVTIQDATMSTTAPQLGAAGDYVLVWQFVSADGHPVSGEIPFEWAPSASGEIAEGSAQFPSCGAEVPPDDTASDPGGAIDWTTVTILITVVGLAVLALVVGVIVWAVRRTRTP